MFRSVITGTGSYIPTVIKKNTEFANESFYTESSEPISHPSSIIVEKFKQITGIEERRYAQEDVSASDLAAFAAMKAITDSGVDPETIDLIIVAHNYGNIQRNSIQTDAVPSL